MEDYRRMYSEMHKREGAFQGRSIRKCTAEIAKLVKETMPRTLIDYGCGKGLQYQRERVHLKWGGLMPILYDIGYKPYAERPPGPFDGVLCVDVMEHIAEKDVPHVLSDIFSLLPPRDDGGESMAFFSISTIPAAAKKLPDGRNVHLTVKPGKWWVEQLLKHLESRPHIRTSFKFEGVT